MNARIAILPLAVALLTPAVRADETNQWAFDVSLYGLAVGMSGDMAVGPVNADVNVGFDKIWDNLEFGDMGLFRLGYDRCAPRRPKASGPCTGSTPILSTGPASRPRRDAGSRAAKWNSFSTTPNSKWMGSSLKAPASITRASGP